MLFLHAALSLLTLALSNTENAEPRLSVSHLQLDMRYSSRKPGTLNPPFPPVFTRGLISTPDLVWSNCDIRFLIKDLSMV